MLKHTLHKLRMVYSSYKDHCAQVLVAYFLSMTFLFQILLIDAFKNTNLKYTFMRNNLRKFMNHVQPNNQYHTMEIIWCSILSCQFLLLSSVMTISANGHVSLFEHLKLENLYNTSLRSRILSTTTTPNWLLRSFTTNLLGRNSTFLN